jgi:hypothetical protein
VKKKNKVSSGNDWFRLQGLNLRPLPCQGNAPGKRAVSRFILPTLKAGESFEIPASYDVVPKITTHGKSTVARWVLIGKPRKNCQKSVNGSRAPKRSRSAGA